MEIDKRLLRDWARRLYGVVSVDPKAHPEVELVANVIDAIVEGNEADYRNELARVRLNDLVGPDDDLEAAREP